MPARGRCRCAASGRRRTRRDSGWRPRGAARRCSSSSATRSSMARLVETVGRNGSASTSNTGSRGSSDATGSWNTTCRSPRSARRAARVQRRDVGAEHLDRTGLRRSQFEDLVQRGRLARAGFADDAERAALPQLEADAVDRPHLADLAAEHHTLGQRVGLHQVPHPQHHRRVGSAGATPAGRWTRRRSRRRCGRRRARCGCTRRCGPGRRRTSSGSAARQSSIASGQRGANGQPGGSAAIDGGAPGIGTSRAPWAASRRGTEPSSPTV